MKAKVFSCDSEFNFCAHRVSIYSTKTMKIITTEHFKTATVGFDDQTPNIFLAEIKSLLQQISSCFNRLDFQINFPFTSPLRAQSQRYPESADQKHFHAGTPRKENALPAPAHPSCAQEGEAELRQLQNEVTVKDFYSLITIIMLLPRMKLILSRCLLPRPPHCGQESFYSH